MKNYSLLLTLSCVTLFVGCATKQYHIAAELSPAVAEAMTCKDLQIELLKGQEIEKQINETGQFSGKTVLGFLGDFGIGNAMAKSEARLALSRKMSSIRNAQLSKGCLD